MSRKTKTEKILILLFSLSLFFASAPASATLITVGFDPSSSIIHNGNTFTMDLIANVDSSSPIISFVLDIAFDPTILDVVSAEVPINQSLGFAGQTLSPFFELDNTNGLINNLGGFVFPSPFGPGQLSGLLTLATLTFEAGTLGTTSITPIINQFDPTEGFGLPWPPGGLVPFDEITLNTGAVTVVPEPCTLFLVGAGLIGMAGLRRRTD
jgi:PEP-CTERM motif